MKSEPAKPPIPEDSKPPTALVAVPKDTQFANSELLLERHGKTIRNVTGLGWHVWDGMLWAPDENGAVSRLMRESIESLYPVAAAAQSESEQKRLLRWAKVSSSLTQVDAAIVLAGRSLETVLSAKEMDSDLHLLNTHSGVVDLQTGELSPHDPAYLMTKICPVTYEPDAESSLWTDAIDTWTEGDDELAGFLQRAAGYTLTGSIEESVLFFAHGPTASGKSTFLEALGGVLGSYAKAADFDSFLARASMSTGSPRNDIARLAGARLVTAIEVDKGKKFAEGLVKQLTGGDIVTARMLRKEHFEFIPRLKLWMGANDRPRVNASDGAMWRRILQIPFVHSLPLAMQSKSLKERLRDEKVREGILAWAVRGAIEWHTDGLMVPERVKAYTEEYRDEVDAFAEFFKDCVEFLPGASLWISARDIYDAYVNYCARNSDKPASKRAMADRLLSLGLIRERRAAGHGWFGIQLKGDAVHHG